MDTLRSFASLLFASFVFFPVFTIRTLDPGGQTCPSFVYSKVRRPKFKAVTLQPVNYYRRFVQTIGNGWISLVNCWDLYKIDVSFIQSRLYRPNLVRI